jgi:hypothetical protein
VINRLRAEKQVDGIMIDDPNPITNKDLDFLLQAQPQQQGEEN